MIKGSELIIAARDAIEKGISPWQAEISLELSKLAMAAREHEAHIAKHGTGRDHWKNLPALGEEPPKPAHNMIVVTVPESGG